MDAFELAGDKIKSIFKKENTIAIIDDTDSEEIKTALQVRIQGIVKDKDVDYYLLNTKLVYDKREN